MAPVLRHQERHTDPAGQVMPRDATPNFEPHLHSRDGIQWVVRMKTGLGEYVWLTDETPSKRLAARDMRRIRQEMAEAWHKARQGDR